VSTHYVPQPWANGSAGNTPVTAETLEHIEEGIEGAHDRVDALAVGVVLVPTPVRTSTVPPSAGQLVTYDASAGNIGPIPLPNAGPGVIIGMVKGDSSPNTITFQSPQLQGNGGSPTITLRTTGENRTLYGAAGAWYVNGLRSPVVGTTPGTFAAGDDSRFANNLTTALYGGPNRTEAPTVEIWYTSTPFNVGAYDIYAQGGWTAVVDTDDMLGSSAAPGAGGFTVINIPVSGRYEFVYNVACTTSVAYGMANCRITRNGADAGKSIATDFRPTVGNIGLMSMCAVGTGVLNQGDQLYWANYCSLGVQTIATWGPGTPLDRTRLTVRYVGPL